MGQKLNQDWNPGLLAPTWQGQRGGQERNESRLLSSHPLVAHHLAVATWMITKPLMSEKWELTRSTCSCLGPLLEGVMLNWTKAFSRGSRLGTLGKGERIKAAHQTSLIPEPGLPVTALQNSQDQGHTLWLDVQASNLIGSINILTT